MDDAIGGTRGDEIATEARDEILGSLAGQVCWRAQRGHGAFLTFDFCEKSMASGDDAAFGEWHLWTYFGEWRISEGSETVATWAESTDGQIDAAVTRAVGRRLLSARVVDESGTAEFEFEHDLSVMVHAPTPDGQGTDWWLLYLPDGSVLSASHGPRWLLSPGGGSPVS